MAFYGLLLVIVYLAIGWTIWVLLDKLMVWSYKQIKKLNKKPCPKCDGSGLGKSKDNIGLECNYCNGMGFIKS